MYFVIPSKAKPFVSTFLSNLPAMALVNALGRSSINNLTNN